MKPYENHLINTNHFMLQIVAFGKKPARQKPAPAYFCRGCIKGNFLIEVSLPDVAGKPVYQDHPPHRQGLLLLQVGWAARLQQQADP